MSLSGLFVPLMKELEEMMYRYDHDYVFDRSKFERRFRILPAPYRDGVKEAVVEYKTPAKYLILCIKKNRWIYIRGNPPDIGKK